MTTGTSLSLPQAELAALQQLIERRELSTVFQPVIDLGGHQVLGFEAAARGLPNGPFHSPLTMFETAARADLLAPLDRLCNSIACRRFAELAMPGLLFLNCSPPSFVAAGLCGDQAEALLGIHSVRPERIIIEITEQQPVDDYAHLRMAAAAFRRRGYRIAVDDLGAGYAGLRFWTELKPDFVKIDRHFIENIDADSTKRDFVRSIIEIGRKLECRIVAEGIETAEELGVVQELGIEIGQGYLLGVPRPRPSIEVPDALRRRTPHGRSRPRLFNDLSAGDLAQPAPTVAPGAPAEDVLERFVANRNELAVVVVDEGRPAGLVIRHELLEVFSARYHRELHGRKPIRAFMRTQMICVEAARSLDEVSRSITAEQGPELSQLFVVTEAGMYRGVGRTRVLLQRLTERQLLQARHSNPLTGLPGNVPIHEQIEHLLASGVSFRLAYCDLNHFKPYNDVFGYSRGDEVIQATADTLRDHAHPELDFVGHIGGDDFIVILQSADWEARCQRILRAFEESVRRFYPAETLRAGGFHCEDRQGRRTFFSLLSLSIGVVEAQSASAPNHHELVAMATAAKREAKKLGGNALYLGDARKSPRMLAGAPVAEARQLTA